MTPDEYMAEAFKTWSKDDRYVNNDPSLSALDHAVKGLVTESAELLEGLDCGEAIDITNVVEETGDLEWYAALALRSRGKTYADLDTNANIMKMQDGPVGWAIVIVIQAARATDVLKRHFIYGEPLNEVKLLAAINGILITNVIMLAELGLTIEAARIANIAKLRKRYGAKFSQSAAVNRDLEAEKAALVGTPRDTAGVIIQPLTASNLIGCSSKQISNCDDPDCPVHGKKSCSNPWHVASSEGFTSCPTCGERDEPSMNQD